MTVFATNRMTLDEYRRLCAADTSPPRPHGPPHSPTPAAGCRTPGAARAPQRAVGPSTPPRRSGVAILGDAAQGGQITITIAGDPVPKGRPRITREGRAYTPAKTRRYEAHIRLAAQVEMAGEPPLDGPVRVWATALLPVPRSWPKAKQGRALSGLIRPTGRPDVDNYIKAAFDGLNEIVWRDDSQVVEVTASKVYSDRPRLVITVGPA